MRMRCDLPKNVLVEIKCVLHYLEEILFPENTTGKLLTTNTIEPFRARCRTNASSERHRPSRDPSGAEGTNRAATTPILPTETSANGRAPIPPPPHRRCGPAAREPRSAAAGPCPPSPAAPRRAAPQPSPPRPPALFSLLSASVTVSKPKCASGPAARPRTEPQSARRAPPRRASSARHRQSPAAAAAILQGHDLRALPAAARPHRPPPHRRRATAQGAARRHGGLPPRCLPRTRGAGPCPARGGRAKAAAAAAGPPQPAGTGRWPGTGAERRRATGCLRAQPAPVRHAPPGKNQTSPDRHHPTA